MGGVSSNATLLYARGSSVRPHSLEWVNYRSALLPLELSAGNRVSLETSPDGRQLAITERSRAEGDIWLYDLATSQTRKLTMDGNSGAWGWMPDGRSFVHHKLGVGAYLQF